MAAAGQYCPSWANLQPALVGLVLRRLPSLADRVRLGAVCRPWHRIALQEPLPRPLPWLTLLDGTFLSIPGGEIHRMHVPEDAIHGSTGNWLLLERKTWDVLELMNPFSKHVQRLPTQAHPCPEDSIFFKLVPLSPSTLDADDQSLDPGLFAVLITTMVLTSGALESVISIWQRPWATADSLVMPHYTYIFDVAFFQGKLYALSVDTLYALDIVPSCQGMPVVSSVRRVADAVEDPGLVCRSIADRTYTSRYRSYLAESSGRLLHIRRLVGCLSNIPKEDMLANAVTLSFEVFEVDLTTDSHHKWTRLHTLGDQALFVGTHSKFLSASECGAQEDCIYFVRDYDHKHWTVDPLRDSGVFNMRNGTIAPLLLDTTVVHSQGCKGRPTRFFPY